MTVSLFTLATGDRFAIVSDHLASDGSDAGVLTVAGSDCFRGAIITTGGHELSPWLPVDPLIDLGGPEGGRYWRVTSGQSIDHPDARSAAVFARVTGSVGSTYNDVTVEKVPSCS